MSGFIGRVLVEMNKEKIEITTFPQLGLAAHLEGSRLIYL